MEETKVSNSWIDKGYRVLNIDGIRKQYSHYIWWRNTGYWPQRDDDEIIHHINGDSLDDRFENLQLMTSVEHSSFHKRKWNETHDNPMLGASRPEHSTRMSRENNPMYGIIRPEQSEQTIGENNPNYDNIGTTNPKWISGPVCSSTQRTRVYRAKKRIAEGREIAEDIQLIQEISEENERRERCG